MGVHNFQLLPASCDGFTSDVRYARTRFEFRNTPRDDETEACTEILVLELVTEHTGMHTCTQKIEKVESRWCAESRKYL